MENLGISAAGYTILNPAGQDSVVKNSKILHGRHFVPSCFPSLFSETIIIYGSLIYYNKLHF